MQSERWKQIQELFDAAQQHPVNERSGFLAQVCPDDPELRAEVLDLLSAAEADDSFLDKPMFPSASTQVLLKEGDKVGVFEIQELIGRGGMGEVYRARDLRLKRDVAIKVVLEVSTTDAERLRRFEQEARTASLLNHPNILAIYDIGTHNGAPYIVSELLEGHTLRSCLARGPIPLSNALDYAQQLADGLAAAHQKGIVHRDLKPENLFLTSDGRMKILDFGLAKLGRPKFAGPGSATSVRPESTEPGMILGTVGYMSPEQVQGRPADARSDIFAIGLILHEMLTGQKAFRGSSAAETMSAILRDDPPQVSDLNPKLPKGLSRLVRHCLEKRQEDRFESARDLAFALKTMAEPSAVQSHSGEAGPKASRSPAIPGVRHRTAWLVAAAVLFVSIATLGIIRLREPSHSHQRLELQINPPSGFLTDLVLSPDGRFLAMVTSSGSRLRKLWIRPLDNPETRLLTELSGRFSGSLLIWSPDAQFIAVAMGDQLCKIPRGGGRPVVLADLPRLLRSGAWLDNGDILLAGEEGVLRVPASGGALLPVGVKDAVTLAPLPGGRFLFVRMKGGIRSGKAAGIFAGSLDGRPPVQILSDGIAPLFVPPAAPGAPSHLLFLRGEALFAQPFDADSLAVRGKAVTVVPQVSELADRKTRRSVTASATGILAYRPGEYISTVELAWLDRSGRRQETLSDPFPTWGFNAAIRLSPDDTKALVPVLKDDKLDMWIADLSRKTMSRLTFHGSNSAIWSPDGKKALWAAFDGSRNLRAADGSGSDELVYRNLVEKSGFPTDWSSDGKLIAFSEMPRDHGEIWLAPVGGKQQPYPYIQAGHTQAWGQFSPNGRWMAYVDFPSPLPSQVVVESIPAGSQHWHISPEGGDWPVWRRDGKEIFYSWDNRLMAVDVRESGGLVEFGVPRKLFEFQNTLSRFQVSRDGKRFLVALPVETSSDRAPLTVDTDWRAGLAK